jgi:tRNA A37 methylthiotransferase MiaB
MLKAGAVFAGPDSYRDLPRLLQLVGTGKASAMNVQLSADETYADIAPVRKAGAHSAFVSIMRGCSNLCSFCIVPYGANPGSKARGIPLGIIL